MEISIIKDKTTWDRFFEENGSESFLQSWEWGNFEESHLARRSLGVGGEVNVLRLGVYNKNNLEVIAQIIKIRSKRGNFLFIPHGPIFMKHATRNIKHLKSIISIFLNFLISFAKTDGFSFLRVAPIMKDNPENRKIFGDLGFRKAPIYMHAERAWMLPLINESHQYDNPITNISRSEDNSSKIVSSVRTDEEMLSGMRKTTRYLIRKAIKDGVIIEKRTDDKAIDDFYKIYVETAKRENFVPFSINFIRDEFEAFNKTKNAIFLFGSVPTEFSTPEVENGVVAGALIIFTKSTAFYHQGASIHTKFPVTYLLQWEAIKEARKRGCKYYHFWGIHQPGRTPKSWIGLTLFKQGFGGHQIDYVPTQDFIISPKYWLTYLYERFLQWKRGV